MANTTLNIPTSTSDVGWTTGSNLTTDSDVTYASKTFSTSETSGVLRGAGFGFSIPTDATVDGIEVEVRLDTTFAGFTENTIQLHLDTVLQGTNKSTSASISNVWTTMTYGNSTDKWGWTAITAANVNSIAFGLACAWTAPTTNGKLMYVNTYRLRVYYTEAGGESRIATSFMLGGF